MRKNRYIVGPLESLEQRSLLSVAAQAIIPSPSLAVAPIVAPISATVGATTIGTSAETMNRLLVAQVYRDLLKREADPGGLAAWSSLLDGNNARFTVISWMTASAEYRGNTVKGLYAGLLNRPADPQGLGAYVQFMTNGGTLDQLKSIFLGSQEYFQTRGGKVNAGFLKALFRDVLGREITPSEASSFGTELVKGATRNDVAAQVLTSVEARRFQIQDLYQSLLHRQADPSGLTAWAAQLSNNVPDQTVVSMFIASAEYEGGLTYNVDHAGFVVTPTAGLVTTEAGGGATFSVTLASRPTALVILPLSSSNRSQGSVSPATLTFTPDNWSTPQAVTVVGIDDHIDNGDIAYQVIAGPAASADAKYSGMVLPRVALTSRSAANDQAAFDPTTNTITFSLSQPALTSGGIFDDQSHLVRTLWSMAESKAGKHTAQWDGTDNWGHIVPQGNYNVKIYINDSMYSNSYRFVGGIGNSGDPSSTLFHTPNNLDAVAVDSSGSIYTANDWDEPGADFKKWGTDGSSIFDAQFRVRNNTPNGLPYNIAVDSNYIYVCVKCYDGTQRIERFDSFTGDYRKYKELGDIIVSEASSDQASLKGLVVDGDSLWVADSLGNRILRYDKGSGTLLGELAVADPGAITLDSNRNLWISHEGGKIEVIDQNLKVISDTKVDGVTKITSLSMGPGNTLYLCDEIAGQVKTYHAFADGIMTPIGVFGQKAIPGDRDPSHFYNLIGVAADTSGNFITIQREPSGGSRLAKWNAGGQLAWEQFGNEFTSTGNYSQAHPDDFYTMSFHSYALDDHSNGAWSYTGNTFIDTINHNSGSAFGVPRVLELGGNDFFFHPSGDGVQIYKIEGGTFHLASIVGGADPGPDGRTGPQRRWSWSDINGTGNLQADEIKYWDRFVGVRFGMDVDNSGNIWWANVADSEVWELPVGALDARGNPTYDWSDARMIIGKDQTSLSFVPSMVQHADDGSTYAFGFSAPRPNLGTALWMGGTTLVKYSKDGTMEWVEPLPEVCTGLDVIPGGAGGVMVGAGESSTVYQFNASGMIVGILKPGPALVNGWFDNQSSIAVNRDPRDGYLDVFTEDDYGLHIGWYRVDDTAIHEIAASRIAPMLPPAAPVGFAAVTTGQVRLTWAPVPNAAAYRIERSPNGVDGWVQIGDVTSPSNSYSDTYLNSKTQYYYRIICIDSRSIIDETHAPGRLGQYSSVISALTPNVGDYTSLSDDGEDTSFSDNFESPGSPALPWFSNHGSWQQKDGILSQSGKNGSYASLLLGNELSGNGTTITTKLRADVWENSDSQSMLGVGLNAHGFDRGNGYGSGYYLIFRGRDTVQFFNSQVKWGNSYIFTWDVGAWYWFSLKIEDGVLYGKIWKDGTDEPSDWHFSQKGWVDAGNSDGFPALLAMDEGSFDSVAVKSSKSPSVNGHYLPNRLM